MTAHGNEPARELHRARPARPEGRMARTEATR